MKELFWHCVGYRINWRKLFLAGAIMKTAGVVLQTPTVPPYPLNTLFLSPLETVSSIRYLNGSLHLNEIVTEARVERFQVVPTAPIVLLNSSTVSRRMNSVSRRRKKKRKINDELKVVDSPPSPHHIPTRLERYIWSLPPDEACAYARKEIEHAPVVTDNPDLYAPLFRNVSVFKGWFMRLMEGNRQFVTRNPERAHLFYMPYSARQLQQALYVPNSHNLRPLSIFLRDYVNMIAAKYPFWNRTHGSDHFLVACHDWGPYKVTEHPELSKNTIKALCNADLADGIFVPGKDVSLPETTIRNPRRPLRYIGGGKRVSQRPILAFFAGKMHGRVRPMLLKYWRDNDEDVKIYGPLPLHVSRKMSYIQHMKSSKFCICPMGFEVNSPRIVEAIYY